MIPKPLSRRRLRLALFGYRRGDERQEEKACSTPALGGDPLNPAEGGWATGFFCIVSFLTAMLLGLRPAGAARPPRQTRSFYRRASPSSGNGLLQERMLSILRENDAAPAKAQNKR